MVCNDSVERILEPNSVITGFDYSAAVRALKRKVNRNQVLLYAARNMLWITIYGTEKFTITNFFSALWTD